MGERLKSVLTTYRASETDISFVAHNHKIVGSTPTLRNQMER